MLQNCTPELSVLRCPQSTCQSQLCTPLHQPWLCQATVQTMRSSAGLSRMHSRIFPNTLYNMHPSFLLQACSEEQVNTTSISSRILETQAPPQQKQVAANREGALQHT